jgi:hypothetical protein
MRFNAARFFALVWSCFIVSHLNAQPMPDKSIYRDTLRVTTQQTFQLRKWIEASSFSLGDKDTQLDSTWYKLDAMEGVLRLTKAIPINTILIAQYRVLPIAFKPIYYRRQLPKVRADSTLLSVITPEDLEPKSQGMNPFEDAKLQRSGSITRGVTAGNRRDVTIESGLRMQLSGQIMDGVNINAVLTDENTPIQPEGTTQRLNEIDRVLIQVQSKEAELNLGDFDLQFAQSAYASLNRKLQGVSARYDLSDPKGLAMGKVRVKVAGATSRGIYQTQTLQAQESVQGPYRLQGKQGEQFIIVIAGSERIYLDGQLLTRGESEDYVIDYASGEVTFTSKHLMTTTKRLVAEFEYTTNRFTRSLLGAEATADLWQSKQGEQGKLQLFTHVLREADANTFGEELGLTTADLEVLKLAGDDTQKAVSAGATRVPFDAEAPYTLYIKQSIVPAGSTESVEIFAPLNNLSQSAEVYQVRFTRVLAGEGDYRRVGNSVNGILYEYVGKGQGDYIPFRLLPRPKRQTMVSLGSVFKPIKNIELSGEWGQSAVDQNTLSLVDDADNGGTAVNLLLKIKDIKLSTWQLNGNLSRQQRSAHFETFDRVRSVEFGRQWNLNQGVNTNAATSNAVKGANESIWEGNLRIGKSANTYLEANWGQIRYDQLFSGNRYAARFQLNQPKWPEVRYNIEQIQSQDSTSAGVNRVKGNWFRQDGDARYGIIKLAFNQENRRMESAQQLSNGSFAFWEWKPSVTIERDKVSAGTGLEWRKDQQASEGAMHDESRSWTWRSTFDWKPARFFNTTGDIGLRRKRYETYFKEKASNYSDSDALLLKWNGTFAPFKRAVDMRWQYEALTEKAPVMQEVYREVQSGLGQYQWVDINADGLRQVDEFVPAVSRFDGNYVRLLVPSDELKPVVNLEARWRLGLDPERIWATSARKWQQVLNKFSSQTMIEVAEKSEEKDVKNLYLLQAKALQQEATTLNGRFRVSQEVFFAKANPQHGGNASFMHLSNLNRLAAGVESRRLQRWNIEARMKANEHLSLKLTATQEANRQSSKQFSTRNFDIQSQSLTPEATMNFSENRLLLTLSAIWGRKTDAAQVTSNGKAQEARVFRVPLSMRFVQAGKWQLVANIESAFIHVTGDVAGLAGFELTDGRGAGTSWLWNTSLDYTISRLLRASLYYDGRAPADAPVLHTVRAQLSATF